MKTRYIIQYTDTNVLKFIYVNKKHKLINEYSANNLDSKFILKGFKKEKHAMKEIIKFYNHFKAYGIKSDFLTYNVIKCEIIKRRGISTYSNNFQVIRRYYIDYQTVKLKEEP